MYYRKGTRWYMWFGTIGCTVLCVILMLIGSCTDPQEYDPYDPLDPPPGPPELLYPLPDTNLCYAPRIHNVFFDWTTVAGAEMYEIQTDSTLTWNTAVISQSPSPPMYIPLYRYTGRAVYFARIRAASSQWTNYTDWSDPTRFYLRPDP